MLDKLQSPILIAGETTLIASALLLLALLDQSPGHERMLRLLAELAARSPEEHFFLSEAKNRAGIGARIRVEVVERGERRTIYKHVNSGGSFGASSVGRQMLGLGRAERIVELEVYWPTSGRTQKFPGVALDGRHLLREGALQLETLPIPTP